MDTCKPMRASIISKWLSIFIFKPYYKVRQKTKSRWSFSMTTENCSTIVVKNYEFIELSRECRKKAITQTVISFETCCDYNVARW